MQRRFGISTHLFHESQLTREHLDRIAAHGFDAVEIFATRSHFDYRSPAAIRDLSRWLAAAGLTFHSMHAPIVEALRDGRWVGPYSTAAAEAPRRQAAVAEARAALAVAEQAPYGLLVVHLGIPTTETVPPGDNRVDAARHSLEEIAGAARDAGVRVAAEVIPNALSTPDALVRLIEDDLDGIDVGICLDYGHANLAGDVADAVETVSGHLWTTHVHDNEGRRDDHLVPFDGSIDWDAAMMSTMKVGYDGVLMFEVSGGTDPLTTLAAAARARERLVRALDF